MIKNLDKIIHNKNIDYLPSVNVHHNIILYIKDFCIINKLNKNDYPCFLNDNIKFDRLIKAFKFIIINKHFKQPRIGMVKYNIKAYLNSLCILNFNKSGASKKCVIKRYIYNNLMCTVKLSCKHTDKKNVKHIKKITKNILLSKINKIDYCNGSLSNKCINICFDPLKCNDINDLDIINKCDKKSYYTCVKFNGVFLPELHFCNNYFNGTCCV